MLDLTSAECKSEPNGTKRSMMEVDVVDIWYDDGGDVVDLWVKDADGTEWVLMANRSLGEAFGSYGPLSLTAPTEMLRPRPYAPRPA